MIDNKKYTVTLGPTLIGFPPEETEPHIREKSRLIPLRIWDTDEDKEILSIHGDGVIKCGNQIIHSPAAADALVAWMQLDLDHTREFSRVFGVTIDVEVPE